MTFGTFELELNVVYDKIKSALSYELQNPDWILLRDSRRIIVERRSGDGVGASDGGTGLLFGEILLNGAGGETDHSNGGFA